MSSLGGGQAVVSGFLWAPPPGREDQAAPTAPTALTGTAGLWVPGTRTRPQLGVAEMGVELGAGSGPGSLATPRPTSARRGGGSRWAGLGVLTASAPQMFAMKSSLENMDAVELDFRMRLAEVQRRYKEKQRELLKLQRRRESE